MEKTKLFGAVVATGAITLGALAYSTTFAKPVEIVPTEASGKDSVVTRQVPSAPVPAVAVGDDCVVVVQDGIVHRLDKETLNETARRDLNAPVAAKRQ